jgi:hypothetical protein
VTGLPALTIGIELSSKLHDEDDFLFSRCTDVSTRIHTWKTCGGLVVCALLAAGCDSTSKAARKVEEGAKTVATKAARPRPRPKRISRNAKRFLKTSSRLLLGMATA